MNNAPALERLTIIVAATEPVGGSLAARLARFADEAGPLGQVIVVDASATAQVASLSLGFANVRVLARPSGQLAPRLWRDGLIAAETPLVAFTTAQMFLRPGWRDAMLAPLRQTGAAGVGGPIEPGPGLSSTDRAVALLRYSRYFPPLPASTRAEPAGDNAVYRRDRLVEVESAWSDGFWEVEVHRALRDRGETLALADRAVATFEGGSRLLAMAGQRARHALIYGAGRSRGLTTLAKVARFLASPLVPPLLCGRIAANLRSRGIALAPWTPALPSLGVLASAWAVGEAVGTWRGPSIERDDHRREPLPQLT
jgi:hypothetical protein